MAELQEIWRHEYMRIALMSAMLVGFAAPLVGVFLVQRRLSLIGDGLGHVALAGVAIGLVTGNSPVLTALLTTVAAAVVIELVRLGGKTSADVALALLFYGGIGLGVVIINKDSRGATSTLRDYLFGSLLTTTRDDLRTFAALAVIIALVTWTLQDRLFSVANDEEYARASGQPVLLLNILVSVLTAVTVVVAMRVVGLLLISALMIVPNATAQLFSRSFRHSVLWASLIGTVAAVTGVLASYHYDAPSGATIVLVTISAYFVIALVSAALGLALRQLARRSATK